MHWPNLSLLLLLAARQISAQIPSVKSFTPSSSFFTVDSNIQIIVDSEYTESGSPTLSSFAQTFRDDLISITGFSNISQVQIGSKALSSEVSTVLLTLGASDSSNLTLFNGQLTREGYEFEITDKLYTIKGVEAMGAWWGKILFGTL